MGTKPLGGRTIKVISDAEVQMVNQAALELLKEPGMKVDHDEALDIFEKGGADVDRRTRTVSIPECLVDHALKHAPRSITICGREPRHDIKSFTGIHYTGGHGATFIIDRKTGKRRNATKQDLIDNVIVHDALENTAIMYPEIYPTDVPARALDRHISQVLLCNTTKPVICAAYDQAGARDLIAMGVAIAGSLEALRKRPMMTSSLGLISPFVFEPERIGALMEFARAKLPFQIFTIPGAGTTSPTTLAGSLALAIAELLSGLVLSQLIQPGAPIRLFGLNGTSDMKSGEFTFAAPEAALMAGGLAQMFRFYRVPHGIHGGSQSRSNTLDAQVGYEVGIQNLFAALTGTDLVAEAVSGTLENSNTSHPEQAIIGNEICNYINRILKGIEVTRETLAVDIMREVGVGGQFLSHKHTRQHFREEHYESKLANRMKMQAWEDAGARDIQMRANEEWDRIIANHKPTPLAPDVFKSIQDIVDRASV